MNDYQLKRRLEIVLNDVETEIKHEPPGEMTDRKMRLDATREYLLRSLAAFTKLARREEPTPQEKHRWQANERQLKP